MTILVEPQAVKQFDDATGARDPCASRFIAAGGCQRYPPSQVLLSQSALPLTTNVRRTLFCFVFFENLAKQWLIDDWLLANTDHLVTHSG